MNWLDILLLLVLAGGAFSGFRNGFIGELASLAGLLLGIWGAVKFSWWTAGLLEGLGLSFSLTPVIAFIVTFIVISILVQILGGIVSGLVKAAALGWINKLAGIIAGILKAAVVASVIFFVLDLVSEKHRIIPEETRKESVLYERVADIVPTILPFLHLEQLGKPRQSGESADTAP